MISNKGNYKTMGTKQINPSVPDTMLYIIPHALKLLITSKKMDYIEKKRDQVFVFIIFQRLKN